MITDIAERGWFPQPAVRWGIRRLVRQRESEEVLRLADGRLPVLRRWVEEMRASPVAIAADEANEQHYEVPAAFFQACLGAQLKYSSAFYPKGTETLDEAETACHVSTQRTVRRCTREETDCSQREASCSQRRVLPLQRRELSLLRPGIG